MKRWLLFIVTIVFFAGFVLEPYPGHAESEIDKINKQLKQLKEQMKEADRKANEAKERMEELQVEKATTVSELSNLNSKIKDMNKQISDIGTQIASVEMKLKETGERLDHAMERVRTRDGMLKSRLRTMQTNGFVSYMEVLFSATDFGDFLDRYDSIGLLVSKDKDILVTNKNDREEIAEQKKQIEADLLKTTKLYNKMVAIKKSLKSKESEKEVRIAKLDREQEELEEITEEQEQFLMESARKQSKLQQEINKIREAENKKKKKKTSKYTGGRMAYPLQGEWPLTSRFGYRTDPVTGKKKAMHKGIDFGAPGGTPILAAAAGDVIVAEKYSGYGNCVIIDHGKGVWTLYGHIRNGGIKVKVGQHVEKGQKIAEVGTTGKSTGNHLHFEVRINEQAVDPLPYLQ